MPRGRDTKGSFLVLARRAKDVLALARPRTPGSGRAINGPRNDSLLQVLLVERGAVNALVPALEAARRAGRRSDYRAVAGRIGGEADEMIATVKQVPTDPVIRLFFGRLIDEALGDHAMNGNNP